MAVADFRKLDIVKVNACRLYRTSTDPKISLLDFQRKVALSSLKSPEEYSQDMRLSS